MPDIAGALDAALSRHYRFAEPKSPASTKRGREARMRHLEKLHGGPGAAAKAAGIGGSTWRDWKNGSHPPSARGLRKLEGAYARQVVLPAVSAALDKKQPPKEIHISATVVCDPGPNGSKYKNSTPYRVFRAEKIDTERVINAWKSAGPEAASEALTRAVYDQYRSVFAFEGDNVSVHLK